MKFNKRLVGLLAVVAILLVAVGIFAVGIRSVPVRLSPTTTFITAPLAEDGLPNFTLAILEKYREGVTNENNGARLFWQAVGPNGMPQEEFDALCTDLNISIDPTVPFLVDATGKDMGARLEEWLAEQKDAIETPEDTLDEAMPRAIDIAAIARTRSWTNEQIPPLADWLAANQRPLNLLVDASRKLQFFSPPPNALRDPQTPIFSMLLPHAQEMRGAVRSLSTRAMNRLGKGEHAEAWQDVLACWRLGQFMGRGPTELEILIGIAVRSEAMNATLAILDSPNLPREVAQQIASDLESLDSYMPLTETIDVTERLSLLDSALRITTGRMGGLDDPVLPADLNLTAVDPNIPLEMINALYDQMVVDVSIKDWKLREAAMARYYHRVSVMSQIYQWQRLWAVANRKKCSEMIGNILISFMAPAIRLVVEAQERDQTNLALTRIAAGLALYRLDHDAYPATLTELTATGILKELPNDPFTSAPFRYERRADGYLLYSLFSNRKDDSGTDTTHPIDGGDWTRDDGTPRDIGHSDLVIRLPLPPLELPIQPAPEDAKP